jgi:hypothetical protein
MPDAGRVGAGATLVAVALAGGAAVWAAAADSAQPTPVISSSAAGVAGPLGPDAFAAIPAYFKRVTFSRDQLGQYQEIAMKLPAGRYLVEVLTAGAQAGSRPDCAGVSFPLVPSLIEGKSFVGYVPVRDDGDAATVSCYERATSRNSTATYHLFYLPVGPKSGTATALEHS